MRVERRDSDRCLEFRMLRNAKCGSRMLLLLQRMSSGMWNLSALDVAAAVCAIVMWGLFIVKLPSMRSVGDSDGCQSSVMKPLEMEILGNIHDDEAQQIVERPSQYYFFVLMHKSRIRQGHDELVARGYELDRGLGRGGWQDNEGQQGTARSHLWIRIHRSATSRQCNCFTVRLSQ